MKNLGIDIEYFTVVGKGIKGYLKNILPLRKEIKNGKYDILHAHYLLSAMCATLTFTRVQKVISLMGSEVYEKKIWSFLIYFFNRLFWSVLIVKSRQMKEKLKIRNIMVIPNGVDLDQFKPIDRNRAIQYVKFKKCKNIIFVANPNRKEKKFALARLAVENLNKTDVALHTVYDIPHVDLVYYYNATDLLLLTSLWEGSPNVIKEAMACNCPIVSANVGDVKDVIGDTRNCYVTSNDRQEVASAIEKILTDGRRTDGRDKIQHLDSNLIARKIIDVYDEVIQQNRKNL